MIDVIEKKQVAGRAAAVLTPTGKGFRTMPVKALELGFTGIEGDRHAGWTRKADGRTPWYKRGTEIRNLRQLSLVSIEDLAAIARRLEVPTVAAAWIGANMVVEGVADFSFIPAGTSLFFDGGCVLRVEEQNAPCRLSGRAVAERYPDRSDIELAFPSEARGLRGVVATVERPGTIRAGSAFQGSVPRQWIY